MSRRESTRNEYATGIKGPFISPALVLRYAALIFSPTAASATYFCSVISNLSSICVEYLDARNYGAAYVIYRLCRAVCPLIAPFIRQRTQFYQASLYLRG